MGTQILIPITKAGKGVMFAVDSDQVNNLDGEVFAMIMKEGLKVVLNSRMSKLEATSKLEGDALEEAKTIALAKAQENFDDLVAGKLIKKGTSASKASGVAREVMTEAMRIAKDVAKDLIRKAGMKISHVAPKDITAAAKQFVEDDPSYIERAKAALAERATIPNGADIKALISESPKLVAEAEAKKTKAKEKTLSAKQAGLSTKVAKTKVTPRRPEPRA